MAGYCSLFVGYMGHRDDQILLHFNPFHFPLPYTGIVAVCPDKLRYRKALVGIMPTNPCIFPKKVRQFLSVLPQHRLPIGVNVHMYHLCHYYRTIV